MHVEPLECTPAVFLDRDGTINEDVGYLHDIGQLVLIPGAAQAIRIFNNCGFKVVVVTNQSGVARGYFREEFVGQTHAHLHAVLQSQGAIIDAFYYCPHHPTEGFPPYRKVCSCRKPETGMFTQAARDLHLDLSRSYMVGDKMQDIQAGKKTGVKTVLVGTGYGRFVKEEDLLPEYVAQDLFAAAQWIADNITK
jgi:D,D-heptose 1,7-bisphosphate phosphatase